LRDEHAGGAVEHAAPAGPGAELRPAAGRAGDPRGRARARRRPVPQFAPGERPRLRVDRELRARGAAVTAFALKESPLDPAKAVFDEVVPSGRGFTRDIARGQIFR